MIKSKTNISQPSGFTIVELLIVIVVIGILAALAFVSYVGITQQAGAISLKTDLKSSQTTLDLDKARSDKYPETVGGANQGKGLKASPKTIFQYTVDNEANPPTFCLTARNDTQAFHITQDTAPTAGVCPGHTEPTGGSSGTGAPTGYEDSSPKPYGIVADQVGESFVAYGQIYDTNEEPYKTGFPWLEDVAAEIQTEDYVESENITDMQAWIGSVSVPINVTGWSSYADVEYVGIGLMEGSITVGDGTNSDLYYFLQNGTISMTIDGIAGNTFYIQDMAGSLGIEPPVIPGPDSSPIASGVDATGVGGTFFEYYNPGQPYNRNNQPFKLGFPWLQQQQPNASSVTSVQAWIGSTPTTINTDGWSAYSESTYFGIGNDNVISVGDGSNDTMYYFYQNGTISATIDGIAGNTFYVKDMAEGMGFRDPNAPPPIDCGPFGNSYNFNSSGPAERSSFTLTNGGSECQLSTSIRYENGSIQSGFGTPTLSGIKNSCWWNYTGCIDNENDALMWLQGDAGVIWAAKQNTNITFKYKNGASYVSFYTAIANMGSTLYVPGVSGYDTSSTHDPNKPSVFFYIDNNIDSYTVDDYSNDCHTRFIAGIYGGLSPTPGPYGEYACPGATQTINLIASFITDTSSLSDNFRLMAENGGQITFTTTENNTVSLRIDPSDFSAPDPSDGPGEPT